MAIGWESDRVRLAPMNRARHFENCLNWVNDPDVTEWLCIGDYPTGEKSQSEWFDRMTGDTRTDVVFAIELLDGTHIGQTGIHEINRSDAYGSTGSFIGVPEMRGKGYGTEAAKLRAWYCFEVLGFRMIMSGYFSGNDRSARMSEKAGYVEYGRIPGQFWKRGAYRDHVLTLLTRDRWMELSQGQKNW
ncbi:hypothetical protein CCB80_14935 [Armatimonadetes bacterium Uphvl-Ar1]|nr:hypothetical protein CCB80_14935 [Armatimonadetes bacterium Uphvl-Ar1]